MCTYEDCIEPTVLYDSWEDWVRHEQWAHRQRIWRCPDHSQHEYTTRSAYEDHVKMQHADSKLLLLSSELLRAQESVSRALDRPCPICHREYEDTFEMQQHLASHLEAVALLSVPNLDEDKKSTKDSNSANSNHAESKAGDFDTTEQLFFPENEGPDNLWYYSSEAEKRAFRTKLGIMNQSFNKASSESIIARSRYCEDLVRYWLDGVEAGPKNFSNVLLTDDIIETYKQLAQVLRVISLKEDPDEQLLHLSWAVVRFLPDVIKVYPSHLDSESEIWSVQELSRVLKLCYGCMGRHMRPLRQAPSNGLSIFVDRVGNRSFRSTRLSLGNSQQESSDIILRLVDNVIRLLENIEGPLINLDVSNPNSTPQSRMPVVVFTFSTTRKSLELIVSLGLTFSDKQDATKALRDLLASHGWTYRARDSSEYSIALKLDYEEVTEMVDDFKHSYQELVFL